MMVFDYTKNKLPPNHALQRTRRERRDWKRGVPCARSLSMGR